MRESLDLDRYPIDRPGTAAYESLAERCRTELERDGMFNLEEFVLPEVIRSVATELTPLALSHSSTHAREHNVYFLRRVEGLAESHPALRKFKTINHTL